MSWKNTSIDTSIITVGKAALMQTIIRCAAIIGIAWLCLHYADSWIQAVILGGAQ